MLLTVQNAAATPQTQIVRGHETLTDRSGTLAGANTWQTLAPANPLRSGVFMQNLGMNPMQICEMTQPGDDLEPAAEQFWNVAPGAFWPPSPGFPTTVGPVLVQGTQGDTWAAREW